MNLRTYGFIAVTLMAFTGCREPNAPETPASGPIATAPEDHSGKPATAPALAISTLCNIESIDGTAFGASSVAVARPVRIVGWLGSDSGTAPQAPMLRLADAASKVVIRDYPLKLAIERPDVAQVFPGKQGLQSSGFEVVVDPKDLAAGVRHLYLVYQDGAAGFVCDNGRQINVVL